MKKSSFKVGVIGRTLTCAMASLFTPTLNAQDQQPVWEGFTEQYCSECHNAEDWAGGLDFSFYDAADPVADAELWEQVMVKFRGNMMPPQGNPRPDAAELAAFVDHLQSRLDSHARSSPDPGPASLHRLNRTEYGNAIRDLLHINVDISEYLPADDEGYGFDNIADVLRSSPTLLDQYMNASARITELAVGDTRIRPVSKVYKVPPDRPQGQHIPGLPPGTRGGMLIDHYFPVDGEYDFRAFLTRNIVGYMTGLEWPHQFEISIDGEQVFSAQVGGEADNLLSDRNFSEAADTIDDRLQVRVPVSAGQHRVVVTFLDKNAAESHEPLELHTRDLDLQNMNGLPTLDYVDIIGPYNIQGPGDTASRDRIFSCYPRYSDQEAPCARQILTSLARLAYRRPVSEQDMRQLMGFYRQGHEGGGFERGIQTALRFILASPQFIFRSEPDPEGMTAGEIYALDDLHLASRLSFFLWSSLPDDELLSLAERGRLSDPAVLDAQVDRMLQHPKAGALVDNFAAQWLFLRNLQSIYPDTRTFPDFDDKLRQAMRTETELLIRSIIRNDSSVLDLLNADYTFVNDRLAQHYGIDGIYGSHFRRIEQPDEHRRGLLGHASILTLTSYPNRTSPVLRGKWVMENILGAPPPPPPPDVPDLEDNHPGGEVLSVRERLIRHQENPACAGCHSALDPLGFALENFDAVGRYRLNDESGAVDARGQLADGTPLDGADDLRAVLAGKPEHFVDTMTEKMLTYALGRGLQAQDRAVVRDIRRHGATQDYRFSAIVKGIVNSVPFRMKRAAETEQTGLDGKNEQPQLSGLE